MNNTPFVDEGLSLINELSDETTIVAGETAVCQRLAQTPQLIAALIARRRAAAAVAHENVVALFHKIERHFNESELGELAFRLQVPDDELAGSLKRDNARQLVTYLERRNRVADLLGEVQGLRPNVHWGDRPQQVGEEKIVARLDVAVVVDVARPIAKDVARYLDEREIEANVVLLQHRRPGQFLTTGDDWEAIVQAFSQAMNEAKRLFSGAQMHFFLSGPGALLFGLGCIWGTVDEALVYHYEEGTYHPIVAVSRRLR